MKHKENILQLRSEGYSYRDIQALLNCSKSTISFHCGENQKEKNLRRCKSRKLVNKYYCALEKKRDTFIRKTRNTTKQTPQTESKNFLRTIYNKCDTFRRGDDAMNFSTKDLLKKLEDTEKKCALTGRVLNISDTRSWHLDHIVPVSKGGDNTLDNCQAVCADVNRAKSGMMQEDFFQLCKEVLEHQGYSVVKLGAGVGIAPTVSKV